MAPYVALFYLHLSKQADGDVWAYGPLELWELIPTLDAIWRDRVLAEPIPSGSEQKVTPPDPNVVGYFLRREFVEYFRLVRGRAFSVTSGSERGYANYLPVLELSRFSGEVPRTPARDFFRAGVEEEKRWRGQMAEAASNRVAIGQAPVQDLTRGPPPGEQWTGTFLFPPVRIGDPPTRSVAELVSEEPYRFDIGPVRGVGSLGGFSFLCTHMGYLAVQTEDAAVASRLLNMVAASLLLSGRSQFVIREAELGHVTRNPTDKTIFYQSMPGTTRSVGSRETVLNRSQPPGIHDFDQISRAVEEAGRFAQSPDMVFYGSFLLESHTALQQNAFDQSFISSWVILERHVGRLWTILLDSEKPTSRRRQGLESPLQWTTAHRLEVLKLKGILSARDYEELTVLRRIRNEVIHGDRRVSRAETERCYRVALDLVEAYRRDGSRNVASTGNLAEPP